MTMEEFRVQYSELMEQYQFIEFHLEGICASLSERPFYKELDEVEKITLYRLILRVRELEDPEKPVFTNSFRERLVTLCKNRNYWAHECYLMMKTDPKTGNPKELSFTMRFENDLKEAKKIHEKLEIIDGDLLQKKDKF